MSIWLPVLASLAINLVIGAFVYGRLTQSVSFHELRLSEIEKDQGAQWARLSDHGERIAKLEGKVE